VFNVQVSRKIVFVGKVELDWTFFDIAGMEDSFGPIVGSKCWYGGSIFGLDALAILL
jgi:hypothetical protein